MKLVICLANLGNTSILGWFKCCYFFLYYYYYYTSQQTNAGGGVDPFTGSEN